LYQSLAQRSLIHTGGIIPAGVRGEAFQAMSSRIRDHARGRQAALLNSDTRGKINPCTSGYEFHNLLI
jgi:hypothetical protein